MQLSQQQFVGLIESAVGLFLLRPQKLRYMSCDVISNNKLWLS